jgi:hypothetical protein
MDELQLVLVDVDYLLLLIGMAWLAILGMLVLGGAIELWWLGYRRQPALFLGVLEHHGLTLAQAENLAGFVRVREAAARCSSCRATEACRRALRQGWYGSEAPRCPNAGFFRHVAAEHFFLRGIRDPGTRRRSEPLRGKP